MIDYLNNLDTKIFLFLNGKHSPFFDPIMYWFSDKWFWLPFYALVAYFIVKRHKLNGVIMLILVGVVITLCDQTASHFIKNVVQRLRPSHEPALEGLIHLSKAGAGGLYGFVSSHAANAFGVATFLFFVLDRHLRFLKYLLFTWAVFVSYSRIYNGVHYPGDVLVAALIGIFIGWGISRLYLYIKHKRFAIEP